MDLDKEEVVRMIISLSAKDTCVVWKIAECWVVEIVAAYMHRGDRRDNPHHHRSIDIGGLRNIVYQSSYSPSSSSSLSPNFLFRCINAAASAAVKSPLCLPLLSELTARFAEEGDGGGPSVLRRVCTPLPWIEAKRDRESVV